MASKYLSSGTPSYTASTRVIAGATMSTAFDSADVGRVMVFRIGSAVYWSRVSGYVSATSVSLHAGTLPVGNGTVAEILLLDQGDVHTYQNYLDTIAATIQDDPGKLSADDIKTALKQAVTIYGKDRGLTTVVRVAGNGTNLYNMASILGAYWQQGKTQVRQIEYPMAGIPPTYLDIDDWQLYDDGTAQDGSNIQLMLVDYSPAATEYFAMKVLFEPSLPEVGSQNFPDTNEHFTNITLLASAMACMMLASFYAPSTSSSISADVVNYAEKSDKYLRLARTLMERYDRNVFPDKTTVTAAQRDVDIETSTLNRDSFMFHGNKGTGA